MLRILLTSRIFAARIVTSLIVAILMVAMMIVAMPLTLAAQRGAIHVGHSPGFRGGYNRAGYGRGGYLTLPLYDPTLPLYDLPLYDSAYAGYSGYPAPEPRVIVLQPAAAAAPEVASAPAQPLMIELQGDRYVQISGDGPSTSQTVDRIPRIPPQPSLHRATVDPNPAPPRASASVVLVFRDGRQQEISAYTIADGILYASANFYTSGVWSLKIPISTLNLADTETANRTRGLQFRVPAAQNEVVVGP